MIIAFNHFMKTGGTSIRAALLKSESDFKLVLNYSPDSEFGYKRPLEIRSEINPSEKTVIYGHFVELKDWCDMEKAIFLRDPFNRFCSHAIHMVRDRNQNDDLEIDFLSAVEEFIPMKTKHKRYSEVVTDVSSLAYVGIMEHFNESLDLFYKLFGINLDFYREHVSPKVPKDYKKEARKLGIYELILAECREDYEIYLQAYKKFKELVN